MTWPLALVLLLVVWACWVGVCFQAKWNQELTRWHDEASADLEAEKIAFGYKEHRLRLKAKAEWNNIWAVKLNLKNRAARFDIEEEALRKQVLVRNSTDYFT